MQRKTPQVMSTMMCVTILFSNRYSTGSVTFASAASSSSMMRAAREAWAFSPGLLASCDRSSGENSCRAGCSLACAALSAAISRSRRLASSLASLASRAARSREQAAYSRNEIGKDRTSCGWGPAAAPSAAAGSGTMYLRSAENSSYSRL